MSSKEKPRRSGVSGVLRDTGETFRGGADGDRTHDLHDANVALSQLSYRPTEADDISSAYRFSPRPRMPWARSEACSAGQQAGEAVVQYVTAPAIEHIGPFGGNHVFLQRLAWA
jgi:hypothetical protein